MKDNTLLILGDSTSMTVGAEPVMYPYLMADESRWPEAMQFVNCSLPGITSADACAFFFEYLKKSASPKAVILSLGTCDAMSSEVRKKRYTLGKQMANGLRAAFGVAPKRTRLKNRLLHFEWNSNVDTSIEQPESADDFRFNLERVIRACQSRKIPVVLVRPKSNKYFPPGVGKGNFVFWSYLGLPARVADRLSIPDDRFVTATTLFERGQFDGAAEQYRAILAAPAALAANAEYTLILVNNYAVAVARAGRRDEAKALLTLLLKERGVRREIVLYNLAQLAKEAGQLEEYEALHAESYEADLSLYRIRKPYLDAIDSLHREHPSGVWKLDLYTVLDDLCYVDHCHALPEGQRQIADAVAAQLHAWGIAGTDRAVIRNDLRNPELATGNTTEFFTYFRSYGSLTPAKIREAVGRLRTRVAGQEADGDDSVVHTAPEELATAVQYALRHPMFPTLDDVLRVGPEYPSDIGRFPELFLVRNVIPYLRALEADRELTARFDPAVGVLRQSGALTRILPADVVPLIRSEIAIGSATEELAYVDRVLATVSRQLQGHLLGGNQVYERVKATIFWYFREVLRYGSHSRVSMRYDRTLLEYNAEALAVASVLDARLQLGRSAEICRLIDLLQASIRVHDSFAARVSLASDMSTLLAKYDEQLFALAVKMGPGAVAGG